MTDLIDRETALSFPFANGKYDHEHADEHFIFGCESYKEWLEGLPVIQQKVGHWIPAYDGQFKAGAYWFNCDKCGKIVPGGYQSGYYYCPQCGDKKAH